MPRSVRSFTQDRHKHNTMQLRTVRAKFAPRNGTRDPCGGKARGKEQPARAIRIVYIYVIVQPKQSSAAVAQW